ncbi:SIS domain-containing protein [Amycolatopsis suaedae]|uniref:Glutamine--fructose-6-phosphate aminotransferase [isomerizing] n=1 Tax=Amycolatopsis suaedae TaxID=2510978 RepID=A0A4Q7J5A0_9PSEU|nr:SIS domain-containing protein [Amycolatopsis suaedae]RZQ61204.1 SIS domain-containing protein [Amycolatopsis suaedae]
MSFALDSQIAVQADTVAGLLRQKTPALDPGRPLVFSGIGTSLHAARIAAAWTWLVTGGAVRASAVDAHDLALGYPLGPADQVVVISHRGYKRYPRAVLDVARQAGATTFAVVGADAPEQNAEYVLRTCPNETAGTFTVSYLASLTVLARLVATLPGPGADRFGGRLSCVPEILQQTLAQPAPTEVAQECAASEPLLIVGSDLDAVTAAEGALKLKEGTRLWAEAMSTEFALHGTPAAFRPGMDVLTLTPGTDDGGRMATLRELLAGLGARVWTVGDDDEPLRFGHIDPWLRPFVAIVPFQRLTAELARVRDTDPDSLHGDVEPWRSLMTGLEL